ncbi:hypothetical protein NA8A_18332 [Nitratireductor indicus C115]|uniref:Uncharacterized protein n=1 Tax=Nitratireductor indicus C115 TaxID=1231190 RepID=K2P0L0_9HYPH|nr:hypothetical protein [Nitratireductor indicus]EKF40876.1 hypothetical protein NA8A_18332 [Nitratireductor indicus C115]SFQ33300.1 hypothetical protein SAMN05216176_102626 [Nitratireductor indicus]
MSDFATLNSPTAIVCHRQVHGEMGGATVWCVVLADGFIIDCGSDGYAQGRAALLAEAVNQFGPEKFKQDGLREAHLSALKDKCDG